MPEPALRRLETLPWDALSGLAGTVLPAIARVIDGVPAEREIDRLLRKQRGLGSQQRTAIVEAIFGVGLWRRRLRAHAGSTDPRALLFALLRDLSLVPEHRAAELTGLLAPLPPRSPAPRRIADRWSYPDWIEAVFLREAGAEADALAAAMCVPGPICLRTNVARIDRDALARLLEGKSKK